MSRVLIVGAGIAGDCLAVFLGRAGWDVTVVEIAPGLRTGGQTVDLRGGSREVLAELGLLDEVLTALVPQRGIAWIDDRERRLAAMPVEAFDGRGFVSSEELLRTDLARILHDAAAPLVQYRFADTVERLTSTADGVRVHFRSGDAEEFDLVVGADGAHSRTRGLTFGPEKNFRRPLGLAHAWFSLTEKQDTPTLDGWYLVHNVPGCRSVEARPGHRGEQEIGFTFAATDLPARAGRDAAIELLEREFADVGWRTAEFLAAARAAPDFAIDTYDQVHLERWSAGRVVLLGDSAWCASPLSGLGTALALHGAAELAQALASAGVRRHPDALGNALAAYESALRPRVTAAQKLLPGRVRMVAPRTALGIRGTALLMRAGQARLLKPVLERLAEGRGHD
ncbi:FAD-dependent monooxygenase [Kineosporia mesophila]|uniref:FAD-dependent monooxygenase n=1 Tax=Kineosporia mesophila TaxID=566012 RepID=A0ABP6Z3W2_9ACTN|nr:FAD-dependent monooxygenase [Kineosporia mesophila]MCD5352570.1 FAD-dependent monooxygenase [Kineosporia mesophila]